MELPAGAAHHKLGTLGAHTLAAGLSSLGLQQPVSSLCSRRAPGALRAERCGLLGLTLCALLLKPA